MAAATIAKQVRKAVRILREGDDDAKIAAARNLANLAADLGENDYYTTFNEVLPAKASGIPLISDDAWEQSAMTDATPPWPNTCSWLPSSTNRFVSAERPWRSVDASDASWSSVTSACVETNHWFGWS